MEEIRYFKICLEDVVEKLREYFASREDVLIAILFGSALRRNIVRDIDIAVYLARKSLNKILRMGWELEEILKTPVDIVPLEQLPPKLKLKILLRGKPIIIRSPSTYTEILKTSIGELEDLKTIYSHSDLKKL
ncbi:nucleotidyltransferase domain-containing protein [Staphylothermus hellenicus]|uniref:DNA polymerase beta domain protein region n=1 Tax=Staphylothermus hellenicus (strain DSM 12710 / JCM 10830 / BK20S6-10-b1 / P8) TaxID=591019 RepID=D7D873_STAHD|nr:nucleotidyltransferase domain-containing protein [Staphylothermus hellenicus]ADI31969.1 DNA polymerase beta domain protein region [Staphylothermus hellenicus DSM 12710]